MLCYAREVRKVDTVKGGKRAPSSVVQPPAIATFQPPAPSPRAPSSIATYLTYLQSSQVPADSFNSVITATPFELFVTCFGAELRLT